MSSLHGKDMVGNYSAIEDEIMKPVNYTWPIVFCWKLWIKIWKHGVKKVRNVRNFKGHWIQSQSPAWNPLATWLPRIFRWPIKEQWMNKESTRFILNIPRNSFLKAALSILNSFNILECSFLNYLMAFITLLFISSSNNKKWIVFNL